MADRGNLSQRLRHASGKFETAKHDLHEYEKRGPLGRLATRLLGRLGIHYHYPDRETRAFFNMVSNSTNWELLTRHRGAIFEPRTTQPGFPEDYGSYTEKTPRFKSDDLQGAVLGFLKGRVGPDKYDTIAQNPDLYTEFDIWGNKGVDREEAMLGNGFKSEDEYLDEFFIFRVYQGDEPDADVLFEQFYGRGEVEKLDGLDVALLTALAQDLLDDVMN